MHEINPYEAPQSNTKPSATETVHISTGDSKRLSLLIKFLIGLQIVSAILSCFYWVLQAVAHNDLSQLQAKAAMFGQTTLVLGMILILLGYVRGSIGLMLVEFLVLAVAIWQMLLPIQ
jgi:hypothetical protein